MDVSQVGRVEITGRVRWSGVILQGTLNEPDLPVSAPRAVVAGVDLDLLRETEMVTVDGSAGTVELPDVIEIAVVTSFLERADGRTLLLKRSEKVGSYRGRWAGISGFLEEPSPYQQAIKEILEETGVDSGRLTLVAQGTPIYARDGNRIFSIHPFRFRLLSGGIRLDWEHSEFTWVEPGKFEGRETVPKLDRVWRAVSSSHNESRTPVSDSGTKG